MQTLPSSNITEKIELLSEMTDGKPEPVIVIMSPPAGFKSVAGVTFETTRETVCPAKPTASGSKPLESLISGNQVPAKSGVTRVHEIEVASDEAMTQLVCPRVTDAKSSGMLVPVKETSRLLTVIVSTSAVDSS